MRIKHYLIVLVCTFGNFNFLPQLTFAQPIDYSGADSLALSLQGHSIENLRLLSHQLCSGLSSDKEKFRAIFRWVCDNISNDYALYSRNKRMREKYANDSALLNEWNEKFKPKVIQSLIKNRSTVCTGYAYLISELAYHAGIPCEVIHGYGRSAAANVGGPGFVNHSWNAVSLDGVWYLCDATWSSGRINPETKSFIKDFSDAYYLTPPDIFVQNHYPLNERWLMTTEPPDLEQYLNAPLVYRSAIAYGLKPISPQRFTVELERGEVFSVSFRSNQSVRPDQVRFQWIENGRLVKEGKGLKEITNDLYSMDISPVHNGLFVLHLMIDDEYAVSYEVKVARK